MMSNKGLCEFCDKPKVNKTPWFESNIFPYHIGAYEITVQDEDGSYFAFSYWNGERWSWISSSVENVYMQACFGNFTDRLYKWRGLYAS